MGALSFCPERSKSSVPADVANATKAQIRLHTALTGPYLVGLGAYFRLPPESI